MELILGLLIIILFIALIVGLVKPALILRWTNKPTRLKVFGYWILSFIIIIFYLIFLNPEPNSKKDIDVINAKDIDVINLEGECEVQDAWLIVMDEIIALAEAVDSEEGASEEQMKEYLPLEEQHKVLLFKEDEVFGSEEEEFIEVEAEDCPNFETFDKKRKEVRIAIRKLEEAMSFDFL